MCEQVEKVGVESLPDEEGVLDLPASPVGGGGADLAADEGRHHLADAAASGASSVVEGIASPQGAQGRDQRGPPTVSEGEEGLSLIHI